MSGTRLQPTDHPRSPRAKAPVTVGKVAGLAVLWSLLLVTSGSIAVRDALVLGGIVGGRSWIQQTSEYLDGRTAADWLVPAGIGCLLLALWLLVLALRPRSPSEARVHARTGVFLTKASLRRLAASAARDVDGVDTADATATLSRVRVTATTTPDQKDEVEARLDETINQRLSALVRPPRVRVRMETTGGQP